VSICRWGQTWKYLLTTIILSLLMMSPYLHYEFTHQFSNITHALEFITGKGETIATERIRKPRYLAFFFPGFYTRVLTGDIYLPNWQYLYDPELPLRKSMIITAVLFYLTLVGYIILIYHSYRHHQSLKKLGWVILPIILFGIMVITLRLYKGDKPDYFLYCFLPFFFIFLLGSLTLIRHRLPLLLLSMIILGHELYAIYKIPPVNQMRDYQQVAEIIKSYPNETRTVIPLNQNIVEPLTFFFTKQEFSTKINPEKTHNILVCEPWQLCLNYQPNISSKNNTFKYDLVTPVDYSHCLPNHQPKNDQIFTSRTLLIKIISQSF
jgi:hypothetical protein